MLTRVRTRALLVLGLPVGLALATRAPAEDAEPLGATLTLPQAVSRALEHGAPARIARLEAERADHAFREARGGALPQLGVSSEAGWSNRLDERIRAPDQNGVIRQYGLATLGSDRGWLNLTVSQILFDLRRWKEIEGRQLAAEAAEMAARRDRDDVAYEVTRRYARLLRLERQVETRRQELEEARALAERARHLEDAGRALEVDRALADLHVTESELSQRELAHEITQARADLWIAMGESEPRRIPLAAESLPRVEPEAAAHGALEAVAESPELRVLDLRRRVEDAEVQAARADRLPTMRLVSGYSHYGPKRYDAYDDEVFVGVDLELPLFDGFRSEHAIRGAERGAEIARLRHQTALQEKRARVQSLIDQIGGGEERLALARDRVAAGDEQVRIADLNLRAERGDLRGSVAARRQRSQSREEALAAEFQQIETWASLKRELGQLSFQILGPVAAATPAPAGTP